METAAQMTDLRFIILLEDPKGNQILVKTSIVLSD